MSSLKERTDRMIHHHATEAAKAATARQEWQHRLKYEIGQQVLKEERLHHLRSYFEEFPDHGWDPDRGHEETDELYQKMEADEALRDLAKELDIRIEAVIDAILFAVYVDREYGSFQKHLDEVCEIWFRTELAKLRPKTFEEEEDSEP